MIKLILAYTIASMALVATGVLLGAVFNNTLSTISIDCNHKSFRPHLYLQRFTGNNGSD